MSSFTTTVSSNIIRKILEIGDHFITNGKEELVQLWNRAQIDIVKPTRSEVITGLLSRTFMFFCDMVTNEIFWSQPTANIILRCMIETEIRLKWFIKKGTDKDLEEYVNYGLGQEKLLLEHYKRIASEGKLDKKQLEITIDHVESWINEQLYVFLLPVDVGGVSQGKDLRQLAEDIGMLDTHRLLFSPLSSAVHGYWNSIAKLNLVRCHNPLHCGHHIPLFPSKRTASFSFIIDAIEIYRETFRAASKELLGFEEDSKTIQQYLNELEEFFISSSERD